MGRRDERQRLDERDAQRQRKREENRTHLDEERVREEGHEVFMDDEEREEEAAKKERRHAKAAKAEAAARQQAQDARIANIRFGGKNTWKRNPNVRQRKDPVGADEFWYDHCFDIDKSSRRTIKREMAQYCVPVPANGKSEAEVDVDDPETYQMKCLLCRNAKKKPKDFDNEHEFDAAHKTALKERESHSETLRMVLERKLPSGERYTGSTRNPVPGEPWWVLVQGWHDRLCQTTVQIRCLVCKNGDCPYTDFDFSDPLSGQWKLYGDEDAHFHTTTKNHTKQIWHHSMEPAMRRDRESTISGVKNPASRAEYQRETDEKRQALTAARSALFEGENWEFYFDEYFEFKDVDVTALDEVAQNNQLRERARTASDDQDYTDDSPSLQWTAVANAKNAAPPVQLNPNIPGGDEDNHGNSWGNSSWAKQGGASSSSYHAPSPSSYSASASSAGAPYTNTRGVFEEEPIATVDSIRREQNSARTNASRPNQDNGDQSWNHNQQTSQNSGGQSWNRNQQPIQNNEQSWNRDRDEQSSSSQRGWNNQSSALGRAANQDW